MNEIESSTPTICPRHLKSWQVTQFQSSQDFAVRIEGDGINQIFYFQHNYFYLLNIKEYGRVLGVETERGGRLDSAVAGSSGMCSVGGEVEGERKVEYSEGSLEQHSVNTSRNISTLTRGVIAIQNGPLFTCWAAGLR